MLRILPLNTIILVVIESLSALQLLWHMSNWRREYLLLRLLEHLVLLVEYWLLAKRLLLRVLISEGWMRLHLPQLLIGILLKRWAGCLLKSVWVLVKHRIWSKLLSANLSLRWLPLLHHEVLILLLELLLLQELTELGFKHLVDTWTVKSIVELAIPLIYERLIKTCGVRLILGILSGTIFA